MILRRIFAVVALLCAFALPSYAQTGSPKTAAQLNTEINSLYPDQSQGAITPFDIRQVSLDQVASGIIGTITLSGDISGSGINSIITTLGIGAVHSTNLNADVFSTARSWSALQTFSGGVTGLPSPVNPTDAATKQYVDGVSSGIVNVGSSLLATATVLPNTPTYSNGSSGVGATLTAGSNTTLTVDGTSAPLNTVVLVKNQASAFQNGIYTVTTAGSGSAAWVLTRTTFFNIASQMRSGSYTFVTGGTTNLNSGWTLAANVTTVGTDPLNWNQFSASGNGVQSIGSGLYTGAVSNAQVTSSCNVFTSSLSGCVPSSAGTISLSQLSPSGSWSVPVGVVLGSRAIAAGLNLTGVSSVTTQGYAAPGDGGGATFKNVGTGPFIDSFISTGFINQAGTGCTNGTYAGVFLAGGTGNGGAVAEITVSGGSVTSLSLNASPGSGYTVGDQLNQNGAFTCTGNTFNWQVSAVTTPSGSFTDSAGNHWQYNPNGGYVYATQFGVKADWTPSAGDAGSTNNTTPIQNAMNYAAAGSPQLQAAGGYIGQRVILPKGGVMSCALNVPPGVWLMGVERYATLLKACDVLPTTSHFVTLCDPNTLSACIAARFSDLTMFPGMGTPVAGTSFIFTNNDQEEGDELQHLSIQSGLRECIHLSVGYGGAALFGMHEIECGPADISTNVGIFIEYASALIPMNNILIATGPTGAFTFGIDYVDGYVDINMYNAENVQTPLYLNNTTSNGTLRVHNYTCGARCVYAITRQSGSLANSNVAGMITGGSSGTLNNAGSVTAGQIILDKQF